MSAKVKEDWTPQDYTGSLKWATSSLTFSKVKSTKKQYKTLTQPNVLEPYKNKEHLAEKPYFSTPNSSRDSIKKSVTTTITKNRMMKWIHLEGESKILTRPIEQIAKTSDNTSNKA